MPTPSLAHGPAATLAAALAASLSFVAPIAPAGAQGMPGSRPISIVVSGGAAVPTGGFDDYHDLGVHADVSVLVNIAGVRFRPEFTYNRFAIADRLKQLMGNPAVLFSGTAPASGVATSVDYSSGAASTLLGAFGNLEFPLAGGLYLLGGIGVVGLTTEATPTGGSFDATKLSYNGGAGFRFAIGPIAGFIEGRLAGLSVTQGQALFKDVRTIPLTFGLAF